MANYVALLRGINLGSNRRVAMADLRGWLTDLGYVDVLTHLQSGNAVFRSSKRSETVAREIEARLAKETGFAVDCVMRTADELRAIVDADPLGGVVTNPSRYMVSFLAKAPDKDWRDWLADLDPTAYEPERFHLGDRELYVWCPDGVRDSKVLRELAATPSQVVATTRNWNTVTRLQTLSGG
jgi:uncharacterized protein (DUF1697 family)